MNAHATTSRTTKIPTRLSWPASTRCLRLTTSSRVSRTRRSSARKRVLKRPGMRNHGAVRTTIARSTWPNRVRR